MNKKVTCSIVLGIAVSAFSTFAAEDSASLRTELDALNQRLDAMEKESNPTPAWIDKIKVKGDLRYRFQHVEAEETDGSNLSTTKNIQRIRARLGVFADVNDWITAGIGIRTGEKANSGNVTIGDGFAPKDFSLSLAYFTLAPEDAKYGSATFGKMKQQWKNATDMIWDSDVNPEGVAYAYSGKAKQTGLLASAGFYTVVDTKATAHDATLAQGQLVVAQPIGKKTKLTVGGSFYGYDNATDVATYAVDYDIAEFLVEYSVKDIGPVPFKFYGNYVNNLVESNENQGYCAGIKFGSAKKGKWEVKYDYRDLELYAAPPAFTDSDFADGGTGVKGHRIKAKYNLAKNLAGGITYINSLRTPARSLNQDQQFNTLMLDLMIKF